MTISERVSHVAEYKDRTETRNALAPGTVPEQHAIAAHEKNVIYEKVALNSYKKTSKLRSPDKEFAENEACQVASQKHYAISPSRK